MPHSIPREAAPPCQPPTGAAKNAPADMVVFYVGGGRDFDDEIGPDGYVLRVVFLDSAFRSVSINRGALRVRLLQQPEKTPWAIWDIDAAELASMWIPSRLLDGYMLRLSWGTTPPARGDFVFYVYYYPDGLDAAPVYCRRVFCQDYQLRTAEPPAGETTDALQ